jgi:hypothetical protein
MRLKMAKGTVKKKAPVKRAAAKKTTKATANKKAGGRKAKVAKRTDG